MEKEYPKTIKVSVQKEVTEEVEMRVAASNEFGAVYVDMDNKRFHIVGDKTKCLVVLAKDWALGADDAEILFLLMYSFEEV